MIKKLAILILILVFGNKSFAQDSLRTYYSWSLDAYKQKNYQDFLKFAKRANELRPNHPILAYNIAAAYALNGDQENAIEELRSYLKMNASTEYTNDEDFSSLKENPAYQQLTKYVADQQQQVENSEEILSLDQTSDHFESISYIAEEGVFLLGTITTRSLYKYDSGQRSTLLCPDQSDSVYGVMGIDYNEDIIWVCTAALPEINNYSDSIKNQSSVFGISQKTGEILFKHIVPNAILGDIVYYKDGMALASDGLNNTIYSITASDVTIFADLSANVMNLQGISIHKNLIYCSDYLTGLYIYDTGSKELIKIKSNDLYSEKGTDGVIFQNNRLYCFQNGTSPKRVFSITIENNQATEINLIDQNLYDKGEPTQGVIVGNQIYYIGNSAWDGYVDGKYQPSPDLKIRSIKTLQ